MLREILTTFLMAVCLSSTYDKYLFDQIGWA
jgi:hypothetical protein